MGRRGGSTVQCECCGDKYKSNYRGAHPVCEQCRAGGQPIGRSTATLARSSGSEAAAATVIQAHFRGFSVRDLLVPSTFDMHELKQVRPNPNHNANPNPNPNPNPNLTLTNPNPNQLAEELEAAAQMLQAEPPPGQNAEVWRANALANYNIKKRAAMSHAAILEDEPCIDALGKACLEGNVDAVLQHLDAGREPAGESLALACVRGHVPVVRLLLERGASVQSTAYSMPALTCAVLCESTALVALLIDHHADCTATTADGSSALSGAASSGQTALVALMLGRLSTSQATAHVLNTTLLAACQKGQTACALLLIEAGAQPGIELVECSGMPILCSTCFFGQLDCAMLLLDHSADINAGGATGGPIVCASQHAGQLARASNTQLVRALLARGARVNSARVDGITGIVIACAAGSLECVKLLSSYGARRSMPRIAEGVSDGEWDAVECAEEHGHPAVAKWLRATANWTPLHHIEQLDEQRVEELTRSGGCVHAPVALAGDVYVTPFTRALNLLSSPRKQPVPVRKAAALIVTAGRSWSCAAHQLTPEPKRRRAMQLLHLGYQIARKHMQDDACEQNDERAFIDVWRGALMPIALDSELCIGTLVHLSLKTDDDLDHRLLDGCVGIIRGGSSAGTEERIVAILGCIKDGVHLDQSLSRHPTDPTMQRGLSIRLEFMTPAKVAADGTIQPPQASLKPSASRKERKPPAAAENQWPSEQARDDLVGEHVRVHGLTGQPELNGSQGLVHSWDAERGRYAVALERCTQPILLRPGNLELARGSGGGGGSSAAPSASQHLRQRQAERGISRSALEEAIREGERAELPDDTVRYQHKGVVYVTKGGVGLTAYRLEPEQCICKLTSAKGSFERGPNRHMGSVSAAIGEIQMGMMQAQFSCLDCLHCKKHRTSTDPAAMHLETLDLSLPKFRGVLGEGYMRGLLLLMAAGSQLVPVRCTTCHGVQRLRRSPNYMDEGAACTWIRHLLNLNPRTNSMPLLEFREVQLAGGCTPLSAAAKAGHFRCCADLLRFGADRSEALMDLNGPLVGGHVVCYLNRLARMEHYENTRQGLCAAYYPEILAMLSRPWDEPVYSEFNCCVNNLQMLAASYEKEDGTGDSLHRADDLTCAELTCTFQLGGENMPGLPGLKPGGKFGFMWDGFYWRQLLRGPCAGPPRCTVGERCIEAATYAASAGVCYFRDADGRPSTGMGMDPMNNLSVKGFIQHECGRAGCNAGECQLLGRHGRVPPGLGQR
jgi:ankyrin repeat protein